MSDIRLTWNVYAADLSVAENDLVLDEGLETAVILSLFTDRRSNEGDVLPDGQSDRRGWWGDAFPTVANDKIGSRLWLLYREKEQAAVLLRAKEYALESLQWLIEDQIAAAVDVIASVPRRGMLGLEIAITRPLTAPVVYRYEAVWAGQEARVH